jgi:hypothetical protein
MTRGENSPLRIDGRDSEALARAGARCVSCGCRLPLNRHVCRVCDKRDRAQAAEGTKPVSLNTWLSGVAPMLVDRDGDPVEVVVAISGHAVGADEITVTLTNALGGELVEMNEP